MRFSETVDVLVAQAVEQVLKAIKIPSRDRILQCTVEQILDDPVLEKAEQLAEVPKIVSRDRIQQRTVEQTVDTPVPQDVEELAEVSKIFHGTGFNSVLRSRPPKLLLFHSL